MFADQSQTATSLHACLCTAVIAIMNITVWRHGGCGKCCDGSLLHPPSSQDGVVTTPLGGEGGGGEAQLTSHGSQAEGSVREA